MSQTPSPRWYMPTAVAGLLWNLAGCVAYLSDVTLSADDLAAMTEAQQALYAARPTWAVAATAIAVWGGALGCVGLIARKSWAPVVLAASLAGVVVQDIGLFLLSNAAADAGSAVYVLQGLVLLVAVGLFALGRQAAREGWLASR